MKQLEYLETRAEALAEEIDMIRGQLQSILWKAEDECAKLGDNPRARKILENIMRLEYEIAGVSFDPYAEPKLTTDERAAQLLTNQFAFVREKERNGEPTESAASVLDGMHLLLGVVAVWRRDENGKYTVVTR